MVARRNRNHSSGDNDERRNSFDPQYEPFKDENGVELDHDEVDGSVSFMNPTRATYDVDPKRASRDDNNQQNGYQDSNRQHRDRSYSDVQYKWTSRDNRKGRHPLQISGPSAMKISSLPSATSFSGILKGLQRMVTCLSSDVSYLGAIAMTAACIFLVTNAILSFLPYANPNFQPPQWITTLEGVLTLIGCALFLTSSSLGFIEAVNQDRRGCFGWKQESAVEDESSGAVESEDTTLVPDWSKIFRRNSISNLFRRDDEKSAQDGETTPLVSKPDSDQKSQSWQFFPTYDELRNHYIYDLGFLACSILLLSSEIYCASAAAALITILTSGSIIRWIRIPQFVASLGFTGSSALFMLETQEEWWWPQFSAIGWWISFLNLVGSGGFALSAFFPLSYDASWAQYQLSSHFFWGEL